MYQKTYHHMVEYRKQLWDGSSSFLSIQQDNDSSSLLGCWSTWLHFRKDSACSGLDRPVILKKQKYNYYLKIFP